jgi:hypothetical protein
MWKSDSFNEAKNIKQQAHDDFKRRINKEMLVMF